MAKIIKVVSNGKRGVASSSILNNVDFKNDVLTIPLDAVAQFVKDENQEQEFIQTATKENLNMNISLDTLTNNNVVQNTLQLINKTKKLSSTDIRLMDVKERSLTGKDLFFEQFEIKFSDLSDVEFTELYNKLRNEASLNNPALISFLSKADESKTIYYTASTKVLKDVSKNESLLVAYSSRTAESPYLSSLKNVSDKTKANVNWDFLAKNLFKITDTMDSDLVIYRGSSFDVSLKSTFFENLTEDEQIKEEEIKSILDASKNVKSFDNNLTRGSMSPDSSKDYVEKKEINEAVVEIDKKTNSTFLDSLFSKKETLRAEMEAHQKNGDLNKANQIAGKMFEISQQITKIEKETPIQEKAQEPMQEKVENSKKEDVLNNTLSSTEKEVITESKELDSKIEATHNNITSDIVDEELKKILSIEVEAISLANLRKTESAPALADTMIKEFKIMFEQGGSLISNVEKINQKYRDNAFAFELFQAKLKYELKASILKDKIINQLNSNIESQLKTFTLSKDKYESKISELTSSIKELTSKNSALEDKYTELENEFEAYEEVTIPKLEEYREKLKDYEEIKAKDSSKDELIATMDSTIKKLQEEKKESSSKIKNLEEALSNYNELKSFSGTQREMITELRKENTQIKDSFDVVNKTNSQLLQQLKNLEDLNARLKGEITSLSEKLETANSIKEVVKESGKLLKEVDLKEKELEKASKKIALATPLSKEDIKIKAEQAENQSKAWHRLNLVFLEKADMNKAKQKFDPITYNNFKGMVDELVQADLAYNTSGIVGIKENAKRVIYEAPDADINTLKDMFNELQALSREDYKPQAEKTTSKAPSYKKTSK